MGYRSGAAIAVGALALMGGAALADEAAQPKNVLRFTIGNGQTGGAWVPGTGNPSEHPARVLEVQGTGSLETDRSSGLRRPARRVGSVSLLTTDPNGVSLFIGLHNGAEIFIRADECAQPYGDGWYSVDSMTCPFMVTDEFYRDRGHFNGWGAFVAKRGHLQVDTIRIDVGTDTPTQVHQFDDIQLGYGVMWTRRFDFITRL